MEIKHEIRNSYKIDNTTEFEDIIHSFSVLDSHILLFYFQGDTYSYQLSTISEYMPIYNVYKPT